MNLAVLPGSLVFALILAPQGVELTAPITQGAGRTTAIDTSVAVYDVNDIIRMRVPENDARTNLEEKLQLYLQHQEEATHGWRGERAVDVKAADAKSTDPKAKEIDGADAPSPEGPFHSRKWTETHALAEIAKRYMLPAFASDHEQLDVPSDGMLVANLGPEQHAWLAKFLRLQKVETGVNEIAVMVIEGPRGSFRDVGLKDASSVFPDPTAFASIRERLAHDERFTILSCPRVATANGQQSSISVLNQIAYVKDWKVTVVEPGPQEIADPTIDIVQDGFVFDMRATALAENSYGLDLAFKVSKLERPMASRKMRISASSDKEVEVGVPVVTKIHFESNLILSSDASAVFTTASPERDKDIAILLTLKHHAL